MLFQEFTDGAIGLQAVKEAGFEPVLVKDVRSAFDKLEQAADYDVVFLFSGVTDKELPYVVNQFRSDPDSGRLPILIFAPKERAEDLAKQLERYRNVKVYPDIWLTMTDELKAGIEQQLKEGSGAKLSPEERKEVSRAALDTLWRMAKGEYRGYDVRPAQNAIVRAANTQEENAGEALEILGRLPGQEPQARLASAVLNPAHKFRTRAAEELNRNIQKFGLLIDQQQLGDLKAIYRTEADPKLKGTLTAFQSPAYCTPNPPMASALPCR